MNNYLILKRLSDVFNLNRQGYGVLLITEEDINTSNSLIDLSRTDNWKFKNKYSKASSITDSWRDLLNKNIRNVDLVL